MNGQHLDDDRMVRLILDELDSAERAAVEAHARGCAACRDAMDRMGNATAAWRAVSDPEPPAGILVNLLEAQGARARSAPRAGRHAGLAAVAGIAAAVVLFAGGYAAGRQGAGDDAPQTGRVAREAPRSVPPPPGIAFQTTPPIEAWLAEYPGGDGTWIPRRTDVRDSL